MTRSEAVESYEEPEPVKRTVTLCRDDQPICVAVLEFADGEMQTADAEWMRTREDVELTDDEADTACSMARRGRVILMLLGDTECDDREPCIHCRAPVEDEDSEGRFLHSACREDWEQDRNERGFERMLETA